jgi:hypothetical protein
MKIALNRNIFILAVLCLAVVIGAGFMIMRPVSAERALLSMLERGGWIAASVGATSISGGGTVFNDVTLFDNDKIARITLQRDSSGGRTVTIDGATLTGAWSGTHGVESAGWVRPASLKSLTRVLAQHNVTSIVINDAQLDMTLPVIGRSRIKAKGQVTMDPNDERLRLHMTLWGVDGALAMQAGITGEITPGGLAAIDIELKEGKIQSSGLNIARMGGWVILNRENAVTPWDISAQIVAGLADYLGVPLNNLTLSGAGSTEEFSFTLQSGKDDEKDTLLSVDGRMGIATQNTLGITIDAPTRDLIARINSVPNRPSDLFKSMTVTLYDQTGKQWMHGGLRQVEYGYELDILSANITKAIALLKLRDVKATGNLTGILPLNIGESGGLVVEEGLLRAVGAGAGGTIQTSLKSMPQTIESSRRDALSLLKSFNYTGLEIFFSGPVRLGLEGDITLTGQPPGRNSADAPIKLHFKDYIVQ